jgi:hypothetical protein
MIKCFMVSTIKIWRGTCFLLEVGILTVILICKGIAVHERR